MKISTLRKIAGTKKVTYVVMSIASAMAVILIIGNMLTSNKDSGYAKHFDENHNIMKPYYQEVANSVFKEFPEAKSLLIGNAYIDTDKRSFSIYVKPVNSKIKIKDLLNDKSIVNDNYKIYIVSGSIKNNILVFEKLKPFVYRNIGFKTISEEDWSTSNFHLKLLSYLIPEMLDLFKATSSTFRGMDKIIVSYIPHAIIYKKIH